MIIFKLCTHFFIRRKKKQTKQVQYKIKGTYIIMELFIHISATNVLLRIGKNN